MYTEQADAEECTLDISVSDLCMLQHCPQCAEVFGLEAAVTAGDGLSAEAGSFSTATRAASSQAPSGVDKRHSSPQNICF